MSSQPKLSKGGERWIKRQLANQVYGAPAVRRNTVVNSSEIAPEQPVDTDRLGNIGYPHTGEFSIGATAGNSVNLDLGTYSNLNISLGKAYAGGELLWVAERQSGSADIARGMGSQLIIVNFYNGSGRGTFPYTWSTGHTNHGDEFRILGVVVEPYIASDDLVIQMTNRDGLGGTVTGRFWWKPVEAP